MNPVKGRAYGAADPTATPQALSWEACPAQAGPRPQDIHQGGLHVRQPSGMPQSSLPAIVQLVATASRETLQIIGVRLVMLAFDLASSHKNLGIYEEKGSTGFLWSQRPLASFVSRRSCRRSRAA